MRTTTRTFFAARNAEAAQAAMRAAVLPLFAGGELGFWYDPSDFSSLFQDSAGTIPVTAVGQPVGRMNDKSGRGNHATQATAAARPTLQQLPNGAYYLMCDGVDDGMVTGSINLTTSSRFFMCVGVRKSSDAAQGAVIEHGISAGNVGCFGIGAPGGASATFTATGRSTAGSGGVAGVSVSNMTSPYAAVLSLTVDYTLAAGLEFSLRVNGATFAQNIGAAQANSGTLGTQIFYLFRRAGASSPFNGMFFGGVGRAAAMTATELEAVDAAMMLLMGS